MRLLLLILVLAGHLQSVTGQTTRKQIKPRKLTGDLNCVYKPKYSATQRDRLYPFSIDGTIKLVSFRYHRNNYPISNDTILVDSLVEVKPLTKDEIHKLSDILYNNFYKIVPNYGTLTQCFYPRNAILFFDNSGHLKEHILICFHCDRHSESSEEINWGDECSQKLEKLRRFFISAGLRFGTDKTIELYPGEAYDE